jgi:hypothetical protein
MPVRSIVGAPCRRSPVVGLASPTPDSGDALRRPVGAEPLETCMRPVFRLVALALATTAILMAGASSAFAAAAPSSASLDADWCFQDGSIEYCFDVDGTVHYLDNKVGSTVTINEITRTTVYESGQYVGESQSVQMFRGVFQADGTVVTQTIVNTRSTVGDEACAYHLVLRLADYEAVVYHVISTCGA